jgi:hypothetical protein
LDIRENPRLFRLGAHARHRIAPVAIAGGSAYGAHLEDIGGPRDEPRDLYQPGTGKQTGRLPGAWDVAGTHRRHPHFVALGACDGGDFDCQLGTVPGIYAEDGGVIQRRSVARGGRSLEAAREQDGKVVPAIVLDVVFQLAQKYNQSFLFVVLFRRCRRSSMGLRG